MKRFVCHPLGASILAAALVLTGCIVSGQFVVVIDWGGFVSTHESLNSEHIDLTTNETWNDHKDDIQNIVDVKFKVTIRNLASTPASGEVYVSKTSYSTAPAVKASATRILQGIVIPASSTRTIGFDESATYRENLDTLLDLVKDGQFYIYGIAGDPTFNIEIKTGSQLLVTFSAGK